MSALDHLPNYVCLPGERQVQAGYGWRVAGSDLKLTVGRTPLLTVPGLAAAHFDERTEAGSIDELRRNPTAFLLHLKDLPRFAADLLKDTTTPCTSPHKRWVFLTRLAEVSVVVAQEFSASHAELSLRLPLLYRLRFLLLSAPFREQFCDLQNVWGQVFSSWGVSQLAFRARRAREVWAASLLSQEDHPELMVRDPMWIEQQARQLVWRDGSRCEPLWLAVPEPNGNIRPETAESHRVFTFWLAREFFLRRFMVRDVWRLARQSVGHQWVLWLAACLLGLSGVIGAMMGTLAAASALGAVGGFVTHPGEVWLWVAGGSYALAMLCIACAALFWGHGATYPFALRLGAAAVLGESVVVSLQPQSRWWEEPQALVAALVLFLTGAGYLVTQARAHGVSAWRSLRRGMGVSVLAFCHAAGVAAGVLALAGPVFMNPRFTAGQLADVAAATVTAAAVGFALGVFLQMLWEDRPVTYPLSHLEWRRRK